MPQQREQTSAKGAVHYKHLECYMPGDSYLKGLAHRSLKQCALVHFMTQTGGQLNALKSLHT